MNKIRIPLLITLGAASLFTLFQIPVAFDVSLLALPVSLLITYSAVWTGFFRMLKKTDYKFYRIFYKILQYIPYVLLLAFIMRRAGKYGTPYWYDVVTVFFWCVQIVSRWVLLFFLNEKRVSKYVPEWEKFIENRKNKKSKGTKRGLIITAGGFSPESIGFEALDWLDALVQAVFMVLLIQIFILQLYVIPSESMVPAFLVGDRVVVTKTSSGPKFPLSDVGVPCMKNYKRGEVVVFRNPHYSLDRKSEVKTVVSQIIYMLTFTGVNLNTDESGQPKADPLVKRICGVPGEQLLMQDGTLYSRTSKDDEFKPVAFDNKYAAWNLNPSVKKFGLKTQSNPRGMIQTLPLSEEQYETMLEIEEERRNFNIASAKYECESIYKSMLSIYNLYGKNVSDKEGFDLSAYPLFSSFTGNVKDILNSRKGLEWFRNYLTDWKKSNGAGFDPAFAGDLYAEANFKLNLMIKICAGKLYVRTASLFAKGFDDAAVYEDAEIQNCLLQAQRLVFYVECLDQRNMPVFPSNLEDGTPQYIPEDCYFMMGDNRFNSLDMRHSYEYKTVKLTASDNYSVTYSSCLAPQYVNRKYILGLAKYRFWPYTRRGIVQTR